MSEPPGGEQAGRPPACAACGRPIGVYEPLRWELGEELVVEGGWRRIKCDSRHRDPASRFFHADCAHPQPAGHTKSLHPSSIAERLPNGLIAVNDDYRDRVVPTDPASGRIVWQYAHTDRRGTGPDHLAIPDGFDLLAAGGRTPTDGLTTAAPQFSATACGASRMPGGLRERRMESVSAPVLPETGLSFNRPSRGDAEFCDHSEQRVMSSPRGNGDERPR